MVGSWPQGMMDTTTISNQYSQFKKKREKSRDDKGFQYPEASGYGIMIRADPYTPIVPKPRKKDDSIVLIVLDDDKAGATGNVGGESSEKKKKIAAVNAGEKRKSSAGDHESVGKKTKVNDVIEKLMMSSF